MRSASLVLVLTLAAAPVGAQEPEELAPDGLETDCVDAVQASLTITPPQVEPEPPPAPEAEPDPEPEPEPAAPPAVEPSRAIASLSEDACIGLLRQHDVPFSRLDHEETEGVAIPIRLSGPVAGVRVASRGHSELHEIIDCRLAVAVLAWAPELREAGVRALLHYSVYRPGAVVAGSSRRSGHASALAIDLAVLVMEDGAEHEVLTGWEARDRGEPPCEGERDEGPDSARMRALVCSVARSELFQVVLTPHYDSAHANHVHLELRPEVDWQYVR